MVGTPIAELRPGRVIGGYRVEGVAGHGGMGVVYRATQLALDRTVALKVIAPDLAQDPDFRDRFKRESRLAASIRHPNVIAVYDARDEEGVLFIAMDFVEGTDLAGIIAREQRLAPERATAIISQVAAALDAAHARGLVHRDVKPANILVAREGGDEHVYLTDFGLTKEAASESALTKTGVFLGTVDYVAPEQVAGERLDARADVYALAGVLFHALTGRIPYPRDAMMAKLYAHAQAPPPLVSEIVPDTPPLLDEVIRRGMAKNRTDRYPSAGDLARAAVAATEGRAASGPEHSVATGAATLTDPAAPSTAPGVTPAPRPTGVTVPLPNSAPAEQRPRRRRGLVAALPILGVLALGGVVAAILFSGDDNDGGDQRPVANTRTGTDSKPGQDKPREQPRTGREEPDPVTTPSANPSAGGTDPGASPATSREFSTPRDDGQTFSAAYCRTQAAALYCWTPNDGYTIVMEQGAPYRLRGDEPTNKQSAPGSYAELGFGETTELGDFTCTSERSALSCRGPGGYTWRMPRYKGFPTAYAPDGTSLGTVE